MIYENMFSGDIVNIFFFSVNFISHSLSAHIFIRFLFNYKYYPSSGIGIINKKTENVFYFSCVCYEFSLLYIGIVKKQTIKIGSENK